jgi:hypothetical protein
MSDASESSSLHTRQDDWTTMQPRVLDNGTKVVHKVLKVIEFVPPQDDAPASPNCVDERKKLLQFPTI